MPFNLGGSSGPSQTQVTQSNVPDWLRPQVEGMLASATRNLFQTSQIGTDEQGNPIYSIGEPKPFTPYSTEAYRRAGLPSGADYVAGMTPGQQQAMDISNWLLSGGQDLINQQYGRAADFASRGGWGAQDIADLATRYGTQGAGYGASAAGMAPTAQQTGQTAANLGLQATGTGGERALGLGVSDEARRLAGTSAGLGGLYERLATSPGEYQRYMSPYMEEVVAQQQAGAQRQADIAKQARGAAAARAGAFGGSRQAIENAEANRALQSQLQGIEAQGLQQAYQQAQGNILNRAQLEAQGLAGAQQGLGTALQGGQLGLGALGQGIAGQQAALQGLGQAGQLYGLGMQGAGMGLQGGQLGLGAYGQMGQAGANLANITGQRLRDVMGTAQFGYGMGEQQRQLAQRAIDQQIQNWAMSQETPYNRLAQFNALLRGYATPGQTSSLYQAPPSGISQLAALGTAGIGLGAMGRMAGVGSKAGGLMTGETGIDRIALRKALAGE